MPKNCIVETLSLDFLIKQTFIVCDKVVKLKQLFHVNKRKATITSPSLFYTLNHLSLTQGRLPKDKIVEILGNERKDDMKSKFQQKSFKELRK